jgi:hypothetical protein
MKVIGFWGNASCSVIEVGERFRVAYRPDDAGASMKRRFN